MTDLPRKGVAGAQTLERGLDVLEHILRKPVRLATLLDQSDLSRTTTWRLVQALASRQFVTVAANGELRAGPKLLQLGARTQDQTDILLVARRHLDKLAGDTGHSAFLGRREGGSSVHLHRSAGNERVAVTTAPGTRRALAETSLGRALLLDATPAERRAAHEAADPRYVSAEWDAAMEASVAAGVVLNQGPAPDRINAIAAPVRDASGEIVAAISIASPAAYLDTARMELLVPEVRAVAADISHALGWMEAEDLGVEGEGEG